MTTSTTPTSLTPAEIVARLKELQQSVLISGVATGVGKTVLGLSLSQYLPEGLTLLSFDYENGQQHYVVPRPELANPKELLFYVRRLKVPTLYEVWAIVKKLRYPELAAKELRVMGAPLDAAQIGPAAREVLRDLHEGRLKVGGVLFDTATRLCDLTTNAIKGTSKDGRLGWNAVKDDISEMLYEVIEAGLHLVMTSWGKNAFDKEKMQSTKEIIADILRNVPYFADVELMLAPNPNNRRATATTPAVVHPPIAEIRKSRVRRLPSGSVLAEATWPAIVAPQPTFTDWTLGDDEGSPAAAEDGSKVELPEVA